MLLHLSAFLVSLLALYDELLLPLNLIEVENEGG